MVTIKHTLQGFVAILFSLFMAMQVQAASIDASVDRSIVHEGESLQLDLVANGSVDDDPEFAPLENDFDILSRNKSSSMQIINGQVSSKTQWSLTLMPKRRGQLLIPPIHFGSDQSNPVTIIVKAGQATQSGQAAEDIFMEVTATPEKGYVQAEIIYTVRIFLALNINNASLSEPSVSDADAVVEKLGEDRRYQTTRQGRRYQVVERQYAIFPQRSGKLRIEPVIFNAQVVNNSRYFFDPFAQQGQTRRLRSRAVEIEIKPIPQQFRTGQWLPARNLTLTEQWPSEPPKFKVGEAVTRTLTLSAEGLTAAQLPEIKAENPDGFKTYPDQAKLDDQKDQTGITGQRTEKIAMIATRAGEYVLPEVNIHWWNTRTQRAEVATVPARKIRVLAGDITTQPPATTTPVIQQPAGSEHVATLDKGNTPTNNKTALGNAGFWPWLSLALAMGWLITLLILWRQHRQAKPLASHPEPQKEASNAVSLKTVEKTVQLACQRNLASAAKDALLQWGRLRYPEHNLNSIGELGRFMGGNVETQITTLSQSLYSQSNQHWQGQALWQALQEHQQQNSTKPSGKKTELSPLYL